jgi:hypothetical protein
MGGFARMSTNDPITAPYRSHLVRWFKGNENAVGFIDMIFAVAHLWDDFIDRDKPVPTQHVHTVMSNLLVTLPRNPFYIENFFTLNGLIQQAITNWHIANTLEIAKAEHDLYIAFVLRSTYADLISMCALIIGGQEWAIQVGVETRRIFAKEGFAQYCASLEHELRASNVINP